MGRRRPHVFVTTQLSDPTLGLSDTQYGKRPAVFGAKRVSPPGPWPGAAETETRTPMKQRAMVGPAVWRSDPGDTGFGPGSFAWAGTVPVPEELAPFAAGGGGTGHYGTEAVDRSRRESVD